MVYILYYSRHCPNCQQLLSLLKHRPPKAKVHYLPVDRRSAEGGGTYIILENGEKVVLPPAVTQVPALLLLDRGCKCIFGQEVANLLVPKERTTKAAIQKSVVPDAFSFGSSSYGVASDSFSFLDQTAEELEAKGNGGLRQQHHYAALGQVDEIQTPPDTWQPNKVDENSLQKLEEQRNQLHVQAKSA